MKGQAAIEALLILAVILAAVAAFLPAGQRSNEVNSVMSAARVGANKAITELGMQYDRTIDITKLTFEGGNIAIYLTTSMGGPPDATISDKVRDEALKHIYHAVRGIFPENARPVTTGNYTYDVSVALTKVVK
ncbi:MAG: hypothetical protein AVW06_00235 [Hadesarchaea archaeon DG-33-1]|nr:MAG: hypothetical protein AVW06_00235 [Hadesarchaea archaeon DG-33-1]